MHRLDASSRRKSFPVSLFFFAWHLPSRCLPTRSRPAAAMSGVSQLSIVSGAPDQLRHGIGAAAQSASAPAALHPVQAIESNFLRQQDANQKNLLARIYGAHMPMKMHMEQVRTDEDQAGDDWRGRGRESIFVRARFRLRSARVAHACACSPPLCPGSSVLVALLSSRLPPLLSILRSAPLSLSLSLVWWSRPSSRSFVVRTAFRRRTSACRS